MSVQPTSLSATTTLLENLAISDASLYQGSLREVQAKTLYHLRQELLKKRSQIEAINFTRFVHSLLAYSLVLRKAPQQTMAVFGAAFVSIICSPIVQLDLALQTKTTNFVNLYSEQSHDKWNEWKNLLEIVTHFREKLILEPLVAQLALVLRTYYQDENPTCDDFAFALVRLTELRWALEGKQKELLKRAVLLKEWHAIAPPDAYEYSHLMHMLQGFSWLISASDGPAAKNRLPPWSDARKLPPNVLGQLIQKISEEDGSTKLALLEKLLHDQEERYFYDILENDPKFMLRVLHFLETPNLAFDDAAWIDALHEDACSLFVRIAAGHPAKGFLPEILLLLLSSEITEKRLTLLVKICLLLDTFFLTEEFKNKLFMQLCSAKSIQGLQAALRISRSINCSQLRHALEQLEACIPAGEDTAKEELKAILQGLLTASWSTADIDSESSEELSHSLRRVASMLRCPEITQELLRRKLSGSHDLTNFK